MNARLPYIPASYEIDPVGEVRFCFSPQEADFNREFVKQTSIRAYRATREILDFSPKRRAYVCCYDSSESAKRALDRNVSATMAMAPYASDVCGLVIIHSPGLDSRNGDEARMRRILSHEFTHLFVAERTASTKMLGDANKNMRASSWLNEGLAEVVGLRAIAREERLGGMLDEFLTAMTHYPFGVLSQWLDDLGDRSRNLAFTHATAAVEWLCQRHGTRKIFQHIQRIDGFFDPLDVCSAPRLSELQSIVD